MRTWLASAFVLASLVSATAGAQAGPADSCGGGTVTRGAVSRADSGERYAVYLPAAHDTLRRWPVVIVMDPRGRAMLALRRFCAAAERDGYVVLSSYNTASDTIEAPNVRALNAILADLPNRYAVDMRRIYLAGFSGTARLAWAYAEELPGHVAGILAFGAGLPWGGVDAWMHFRQRATFVWFGGAGVEDFNYDAVRTLDIQLDSVGTMAHRVRYYPGPHAWAPAAVIGEGLDWMQLQAMKAGLVARADSTIGAWYDSRLAAARAAEDAGALYEAAVEYEAVARDFDGLRDVKAASDRARALDRQDGVRRDRRHREELSAAYDAYRRDTLTAFLSAFAKARPLPALEPSLRTLHVRELMTRSHDLTDSLGAAEARRALSVLFVNATFYGPRDYFAAHDPARALGLLSIAQRIDSTAVSVCLGLATAYAELDRQADAVTALQCAAASGRLTSADVERQPAFDRLRSDSSFTRIVATLPPAPPADDR